MKDFLGKDLAVGDEVVYMKLKYRELEKGKIARMTKHFVFVDRMSEKGTTYNPDQIKQEPYQVVKIS